MRVSLPRLVCVAAMFSIGGTIPMWPTALAHARAERSQTLPQESFATIHDRAAAAYLAGALDKALAGFNAAIALNANSALAYYNRGNVLYAKGDYAASFADFTEALRLDPKLPYAHMNRGNALSNLGRFDEALEDLNEAVRLQPDISDVYFNRAIVHVRRQDIDKGLADYELAIARDGHDHDAVDARQRLVKLLGRQNGARPSTDVDTAQIATEIEHARQVEHFLRLASESCIAQGDNLESLKTLALVRKWIAATPEELARGSTPMARLDGGWTFTDRFGRYALIRSSSNAKPPVFVCSLTKQPVNSHMFDDMTSGFADRFDVSIEEPPLIGQRSPARRYRLTTPKGTVLVSLKFAPEQNAITFRTYLGNP